MLYSTGALFFGKLMVGCKTCRVLACGTFRISPYFGGNRALECLTMADSFDSNHDKVIA